MTFKITNPNYSDEVLEKAVAEVINHHDSTELNDEQPIADENNKKNTTLPEVE